MQVPNEDPKTQHFCDSFTTLPAGWRNLQYVVHIKEIPLMLSNSQAGRSTTSWCWFWSLCFATCRHYMISVCFLQDCLPQWALRGLYSSEAPLLLQSVYLKSKPASASALPRAWFLQAWFATIALELSVTCVCVCVCVSLSSALFKGKRLLEQHWSCWCTRWPACSWPRTWRIGYHYFGALTLESAKASCGWAKVLLLEGWLFWCPEKRAYPQGYSCICDKLSNA